MKSQSKQVELSVSRILLATARLIEAARLVKGRWQHGDLAEAVRGLVQRWKRQKMHWTQEQSSLKRRTLMPKYRVRGKISTISDVDYCDIEAATPEQAIEIAWNGWDVWDKNAAHDEPIYREDWGADLLGEDGMTDFERGDNQVQIVVPEGEFVLPNKDQYGHSLRENGGERDLTPDEAEGLCAAGYIHRCEEHSTPDMHVYHTHATQTWEEIEQAIDEQLLPRDLIAVTVLEPHNAIIQIDRDEIEVSEFEAERDLFLMEAPIKGEDDEGGELHIFDRESLQRLSFDAPDCPGKPRLTTQKWIGRLLSENPKATIFWFCN